MSDTSEIALLCDADAVGTDDHVFYDYADLSELMDPVDIGDVVEVICYKKVRNRFAVKDVNSVIALCETREAAEKIAESTLEPDEGDDTVCGNTARGW